MSAASPADCVLVVGGAHVDVIADYPAAAHAQLDKQGTVRYAVGGTAYNIAVNLGQEGIPAALMTVLRPSTYPSVWIRSRLDHAGVDASLIDLDANKPDSGFVALRRDRELVSAVTATAVERHAFQAEAIARAVARARIVVLDCNLPPDQIDSFVERAHSASKPVVIAAVSDSKVGRLVSRAFKHLLADLVTMSEHELLATGTALPATAADAIAACQRCGTRRLVVTRGAQGHVELSDGGEIRHYPAPATAPIVSTTGAGDALVAAILARWYRRSQLDIAEAQPEIVKLVGKVLGEEGATRGSIASEADLDQITEWLDKQRTFRQRWLTHETRMVGLASLVVTAVSLVVAVLAWWYPRSPPVDEAIQRSAQAASAAAAAAASAAAASMPAAAPSAGSAASR